MKDKKITEETINIVVDALKQQQVMIRDIVNSTNEKLFGPVLNKPVEEPIVPEGILGKLSQMVDENAKIVDAAAVMLDRI